MPEEVMTLRALFNRLSAKPDKFKLHQFFERLVIMQEDHMRENMKLKQRIIDQEEQMADLRARVTELDDPTAHRQLDDTQAQKHNEALGPIQVFNPDTGVAVR